MRREGGGRIEEGRGREEGGGGEGRREGGREGGREEGREKRKEGISFNWILRK